MKRLRGKRSADEVVRELEALSPKALLSFNDKDGHRITAIKCENGLIDWRYRNTVSGGLSTVEEIRKYYLEDTDGTA